MENGILTDAKDEVLVRKLIEQVVLPRGYQNVKANTEGYDTPSKLSRPNEEGAFIPDATGVLNGKKSYFELAQKTDDLQEVITKWKLLSNLASFKNGKLFLVVPHGNLAFTNRILNNYPIQAEVVKM
ncbi:hypothetical protein [Flavilitoribacter nigricans]|uniref:Tox-REase-7 domain-containing protein n=1 Tax=Flavilitoribacter nigricans (strain ATCC 23147 / DSM 23189 / NBRC 102662 / NCIMB 1420 / SS-2) TaxID=1122177 RepID=A0A2D0N8N3_FLAN2|nr:hypothetical protein [Flavilitoribacter nigricans]PHN04847.1 hypothetical protein CRP01_20275 [Flavilitoribacter nigricans DSM 23189 = NBRC 102662]